MCHANAGSALEVTALTSQRGLATKERGLPPVQCPFAARKPITGSAAQRAHGVKSRVLPPPEKQPGRWRLFACHPNAGCPLEVTARTSHHDLAAKERGLPLVQFPYVTRRFIAVSAAQRARGNFACFVSPRETANNAVSHEYRLRVGGHSSHVAPRSCTERERPAAGALPFCCPYANNNQRSTARARSKLARGKLVCIATSREIASAVPRARVPR